MPTSSSLIVLVIVLAVSVAAHLALLWVAPRWPRLARRWAHLFKPPASLVDYDRLIADVLDEPTVTRLAAAPSPMAALMFPTSPATRVPPAAQAVDMALELFAAAVRLQERDRVAGVDVERRRKNAALRDDRKDDVLRAIAELDAVPRAIDEVADLERLQDAMARAGFLMHPSDAARIYAHLRGATLPTATRSAKLEVVRQLAEAGRLEPAAAASLLDHPDLGDPELQRRVAEGRRARDTASATFGRFRAVPADDAQGGPAEYHAHLDGARACARLYNEGHPRDFTAGERPPGFDYAVVDTGAKDVH